MNIDGTHKKKILCDKKEINTDVEGYLFSENFIKHSQELGIDCDSLTEMIDNSLVSEVDKRSGENRL